jgi:hypothetical protein
VFTRLQGLFVYIVNYKGKVVHTKTWNYNLSTSWKLWKCMAARSDKEHKGKHNCDLQTAKPLT